MTDSPVISVIVPLYFADPAHPRVRESLLRFLQQFPTQHCDVVEIFLSDSGPPAQEGMIREWLLPFLSSDPWFSSHVRYVYMPQPEGPLSRGAAMNLGISETTGDMLLFLHGDCFLPEHGLRRLCELIAQGVQAGGFLKRYDHKGVWSWLQLTEQYLNWIRTVWSRRLVGTNAMFMVRSLATKHPYQGDFLEDVEMSDWLKEQVQPPEFQIIRDYVTVSSRKYQKYGELGTIAINAAVMIFHRRYQVPPQNLKHQIYYRAFARGWRFWPDFLQTCWQILRQHQHDQKERKP